VNLEAAQDFWKCIEKEMQPSAPRVLCTALGEARQWPFARPAHPKTGQLTAAQAEIELVAESVDVQRYRQYR